MASMQTAAQNRESRRFVFRRPCEASFGDVPITLIDLSRSGAQALHDRPMVPGTESRIEVRVPGVSTRLSLRARVVWSRRAESSGRQKIGLAITDERFDLAADLIDQMVRMRWVEVERTPKRRPAAKLISAPAKSLDEARRALAFVSRNSAASKRWIERVRASGALTDRHPVEVLAAWELLGHAVDVEIIAFAHRERESFVLSASELLDETDVPETALEEARRAIAFLEKNKSVASRWISLVRDASPDEGHPDDVLAAWELLGRNVSIEVVALAWAERRRTPAIVA